MYVPKGMWYWRGGERGSPGDNSASLPSPFYKYSPGLSLPLFSLAVLLLAVLARMLMQWGLASTSSHRKSMIYYTPFTFPPVLHLTDGCAGRHTRGVQFYAKITKSSQASYKS